MEPSPERGSEKIKMLKQGRNKKKNVTCVVQPQLSHGSQHLQRETLQLLVKGLATKKKKSKNKETEITAIMFQPPK